MNEIFNMALFQQTIRAATPVILAALGCLMTQHVNITNIGIDGMMLIGAFFAVLGSFMCKSWVVGLLFAAILGVLLGLFYYLLVIKFGSDEFIIGVALNLFAAGLTTFLLRTLPLFAVDGKLASGSFKSPGIDPLPVIEIPLIKDIPILGDLLSGYSLLVYVSWALIFVCWYMIYKTPWGFHLRASGEYPDALESSGKSPAKMKLTASVLCGVLSCVAGAHLSLGYVTMFTENMSNSRGYVAFACVIFGRGNPPRVFLAALLFGFIDALGMNMQKYLASDLTAMAPYLVTVIMMVAVVLWDRRKKQKKQGPEPVKQ